MGVVDLDEALVPKTEPVIIDPAEFPDDVYNLEDPRLFSHRGELHLLVCAYPPDLIAPDGKASLVARQYLGRLRRRTEGTAGGGWRLVRPRQLMLPEGMKGQQREKNWVPFVYNDTIHFVQNLNPVTVVRVPEAEYAAAHARDHMQTELVSRVSEDVHWHYGVMRGGTPAVYDEGLGGYVTSSIARSPIR